MNEKELHQLLADIQRGIRPALIGVKLTAKQAEQIKQEIAKIKEMFDDYYLTIVLSRVCL